MSEAGPDAEVVFELTVEGELGPVLRCALQPDVVERQSCTVFRATAGAGLGLADLVGMLDAEGLTVESIRVAGLR
jgi:hypothetical protein